MSAPPVPYPDDFDGVGLPEYVVSHAIDLLRKNEFDSCANVLADVANERDSLRLALSKAQERIVELEAAKMAGIKTDGSAK